MRGIASGLLTFEFMNLANFSVQIESKLFQVDPFSFEVLEPDWLSGEYSRIHELDLHACQGGYFNFVAFPVKISFSINIKRCEGSVVDWATAGEFSQGFQIYCFYEEDNDILLGMPWELNGITYKHAYFESCYPDPFYWGDEIDSDNLPINPKDGHDYFSPS